MSADENASAPAPESGADSATASASAGEKQGRALLVVFWVWAGLLVVVTIAQLFDIRPVLDLLDVKRWFAR